MIFIHWRFWTFGCFIILIFVVLSSLYAYRANAKRADGDPKKKYFSPYALWLVPIVLPVLALFNFMVFFLTGLMFGIFLLLFPFSLLLFREPFLLKWIRKQALKIGNMMLYINTRLLQALGLDPSAWKFPVEP